MEGRGVYLYAIGEELPVQELGAMGVEGSEVYTITEGKLSAVVSEVPYTEQLRPERKHLAAHQAIVNTVLERSPVALPVSFGTIAGEEDGVRRLLRRYAEDLTNELQRLRGTAQMNVRLSYDADHPDIFGYLIEEHQPVLRNLRDQLFGGGRTSTREEKIDFGQQIDAAFTDLRDDFTQKVEQALSPHCKGTKRLSPRSEKEIVRLACLIDKNATDAFDSVLKEVAQSFEDRFTFEQSGPFPPYDFAELHLSAAEGEEEGVDTGADS